jgi:hypothetical protein
MENQLRLETFPLQEDSQVREGRNPFRTLSSGPAERGLKHGVPRNTKPGDLPGFVVFSASSSMMQGNRMNKVIMVRERFSSRPSPDKGRTGRVCSI